MRGPQKGWQSGDAPVCEDLDEEAQGVNIHIVKEKKSLTVPLPGRRFCSDAAAGYDYPADAALLWKRRWTLLAGWNRGITPAELGESALQQVAFIQKGFIANGSCRLPGDASKQTSPDTVLATPTTQHRGIFYGADFDGTGVYPGPPRLHAGAGGEHHRRLQRHDRKAEEAPPSSLPCSLMSG